MPDYASRQNVKRLLLSPQFQQGSRRIDFSENYRDLRPNPNNSNVLTTGIRLQKVTFDDSYMGYASFQLLFSDTTAFEAFIVPRQNESQISLGSGSTNVDFTAINPITTDEVFTVEAADWYGAAQAGDSVQWVSESTLSNELLDDMIDRSEFEVDNWILATKTVSLADPTQKYFASNPPVPPPIVGAAEDVAIFTAYHYINPVPKLAESPLLQMLMRARDSVALYLKRLPTRGPGHIGRQPIVPVSTGDKIGTSLFGFDLAYRQDILTTLLDIESRLRNYQRGTIQESYISQESNFP